MREIIGYDDVGADIVGEDDGVDTVSGGDGRKLLARNLPQSFVGIPATDIAASTTGQAISVPVLRNIRPDRLVIDRVHAASVNVVDIKIGTVSLNASGNPVPGDMFAPDAVGTSIRATETATPSVGITLTIANRTAVAVSKFSAGFIGPSTKPN